MSVEQNKALVSEYFEKVVNRVDRAAAQRLVAPGLVFNSPYTPEPTRDRASFLGMLDAVHAAFPDFRLVDHAMVAEGDLVASRWTVHGTHRGQLGPFAPTEKPVAISGLSIYRVADGRIVEGWVQDDTMTLLAQAAGAGGAG
jgi:predicted ester cyclase